MILIIFGSILILDAVISMAVFKAQPYYCQLVRFLRLIIGVAILFCGGPQ